MLAERLDPVLVPVVQAAALRAERVVSASRLVFCVLVLARFLYLERSREIEPYLLNLSALGGTIAYSGWLLHALRRGRATYRMLALSVGVDAVGCSASLLQTVLWPADGAAYRGLLTLPDVGALLLIVYCAGFRVWPRLALLGALLNFVAYLGLVAADWLRNGPRLAYGSPAVLMFLFVLVSVMVLSVATARRTLGLLTEGQRLSLDVERARHKLADLAREHHDARSVISAASVSSDLMMRALASRDDVPARRHAERLREDLALAQQRLREMGEVAYLGTLSLASAERVPTASVLEEVERSVSHRFPELEIQNEAREVRDVRLVGGAASLRSILENLLRNAREGNGAVGASKVTWKASASETGVELLILDDGPGFGATSKKDGMGIGLATAAELVERSGGSLSLEDVGSGARVRLLLPLA